MKGLARKKNAGVKTVETRAERAPRADLPLRREGRYRRWRREPIHGPRMTSPELQPVPANTTILVVDDLDVIRLSLKAILSNAGYRVLAASSIAEAIALLGRESVQLVLCDIQLPGESGLDLVRKMQARIPDLAVVMVSAMGDTTTALDCLQLGAFTDIKKAQQLQASLKDRGYTAIIFEGIDTGYRPLHAVRISKYPDIESATKAAADFTAKERLQAIVRPSDQL